MSKIGRNLSLYGRARKCTIGTMAPTFGTRTPLIFSGLSLILVACSTPLQGQALNGKTRSGVVSGTEQTLASWDKDKDEKLSRAEWKAMANQAIGSNAADGGRGLRSTADKYFRADDANGDGYLSKEELLRPALATFDCMDVDRSGDLSDAEVGAAINSGCPSYDMQDGSLR